MTFSYKKKPTPFTGAALITHGPSPLYNYPGLTLAQLISSAVFLNLGLAKSSVCILLLNVSSGKKVAQQMIPASEPAVKN
jgi:hypothetical protein